MTTWYRCVYCGSRFEYEDDERCEECRSNKQNTDEMLQQVREVLQE